MKRGLVPLSLLAFVLMMSSLGVASSGAQEILKPYGGTLANPLPSDPPELNIFHRASTWSFVFLDPIYDPLVMIDPENLPVPWLAERWECTPDGLIWTVHLVKNATWHDGKPFTAHDVHFTYEHVIRTKYLRWSDIWTTVNRTEVLGTHKIKMILNYVYAPFVTDVLTYPIVPKHIWEPIVTAPGFDPMKYVPPIEVLKVGNGPFQIEEYVVASHVKYKTFKGFFKGRPYIDELLMPIITSPDAMLLALKAGKVDVASWKVPVTAVPSLVVDENLGIHIYKGGTIYHWGYNTWKFPFNVKEFRQAMAHAINKYEVVDKVLLGYGRPGRFGVYPSTGMWPIWLNPDPKCGVDGYKFDLKKAAEILDKLGWVDTDGDGIREGVDPADGKRKPIIFDIGPPVYDPDRVRLAEMMRDWFKEIGVKANVVYLEWKTLWSKIIAPMDSPHKIDSFLLGSGMGIGDPDVLHFRLHSSKIPNPNYYGFRHPEFDRLAEEQRKIVDPEKRAPLIRRMQEILAEELPLIVVYHLDALSVYRTDKFAGWVKPVQDSVDNQWSWMSIYLKALAVLKPMTVQLLGYPAPKVTEGESTSLKVKLVDPNNIPITDAKAEVFVTGIPTAYALKHIGDGVYATTIDTTGWITQPYTLKATYSAPGFMDATTLLSFEVVPRVAPPPPPFWEVYGPTLTAVIALLAIMAVSATFYFTRKK